MRPFPSESVFRSYGHSFFDVILPAPDDLRLPVLEAVRYADGDLIVDNGAVYIIWEGTKVGFVSKEVFEGQGYKWEHVFPGDLSDYPMHRQIISAEQSHCCGTLVNIDGTIYQNSSNSDTRLPFITVKVGIPSMDVFRSHKFRLDRVVEGNAEDRKSLTSSFPMGFREGTLVSIDGAVYAIGEFEKRPIVSKEVFLDLGFSFDRVIEVNKNQVDDLPEGVPIQRIK